MYHLSLLINSILILNIATADKGAAKKKEAGAKVIKDDKVSTHKHKQ